VVDLSSFYFDILKDTLYADKAEGQARRSAQTVLHEVLLTLSTLIAPVLSHLAEDIWAFLPEATRGGAESVFLTEWPKAKAEWLNPELKARWEAIAGWRDVALKALEQARQAKQIGSALESRVVLFPKTDAMRAHLEALSAKQIAKVLIASQARVAASGEAAPANVLDTNDLAVAIEMAEGAKCQRCWVYSTHVGEYAQHPTLCDRCNEVVS
jgi:isoleucyl-tRNA synthetase